MKVLLNILFLCLFLYGCGNPETTTEPPQQGEEQSEATEQEQVNDEENNETEEEDVQLQPEEAATEIVLVLKNKDMETLATYVHPTKGVRFTPYGYVDTEQDQVFMPDEVKTLVEDETPYLWGYFDGSGDPIEMTFNDYYERFVYDQDYLEAEEVSVNERLGQGNSLDNSKEVYPEASVVEYHFPGIDEQFEGMDWRSLRIVIEEEDGKWWLVGVIHDEWTI